MKTVASPPNTDHSIVFPSWRQCASRLIHGSQLGPGESAATPNGISIISTVFAQLTVVTGLRYTSGAEPGCGEISSVRGRGSKDQ